MGTSVPVNGFALRATWADVRRGSVWASVELVSLADGRVVVGRSAIDLGNDDRRPYELEQLAAGIATAAGVSLGVADEALIRLRHGLADGTVAVDTATPLEAVRRAAIELGLPEPVPPPAPPQPHGGGTKFPQSEYEIGPSPPPPPSAEQCRQLREQSWRRRWPWRPSRPGPKGGATRARIREWSAWRRSLPQDVPRFPSGRRVKDYYMRRVRISPHHARWTTWADIDSRLLHDLLVDASGEMRASVIETMLEEQSTPIPKRCLDCAKARLRVVTSWRGRTAWWRLPDGHDSARCPLCKARSWAVHGSAGRAA